MTEAPAPVPAKVLVLLATYRGEVFVDRQIASLLWQVDVDADVLVRDDGSVDGTVAACERWVARYPDRISILRDGDRTGSAPGNFFRLLAAAALDRYDFVALADQDDVWFPDKLVRAIDAMRDADADGYSCDLLAFDEKARKTWILAKSGHEADLDYLFQGASAGCTYVLSAAAARTVRQRMAAVADQWPHRLSHDWTIYAICRSHGFGWVRDPRPGLLYRQHDANDYGANSGWAGMRHRFRAVRDDWYRQHVLWLRRVVAMTPPERAVFAAINANDRRWLARNARRFRRTRRDARLLAMSFLTGLF